MAAPFTDSNKLSDSIQGGQILDKTNDYQTLRKKLVSSS